MASKGVFESCEKCPITFLANRNNEAKDTMWTELFAISREMCKKYAWDKARKSYNRALDLAEDLASVKDKSANHIKATVLTCIGTLSLCDELQANATENLRRGEELFSQDGDKYGQAVALFALGVFYETQEDWREVFRFYERSQRMLANSGNDAATSQLRDEIKRRHKLAQDRWREIEIGDVPKPPPPPPGKSNLQGTFLEFLPIFSQIPAGDPRPIADRVTGYIETDHLLINDKAYVVSNPKNPRLRLKFSPEVSYIALRVNGDSMNNAGIDDGDYVIVQTRTLGSPPQPQNGDIVAAALSEENEVTLKRFRRETKQIILEPDSRNPNHKTFTFETRTDFSLPVRIVGVLVAVLKPQ